MKLYEDSITEYNKGFQIAYSELGENHPLTKQLWGNLKRAMDEKEVGNNLITADSG